MNTKYSDEELLKKIARAMVQNPRSTIKELAESSGISNATLYRFCGSKENLDNILLQKGENILDEIIEIANKKFDDYALGLEELANVHYKHNEILQLLYSLQITCSESKNIAYFKALDNFFLEGQKQGEFRIDFNTSFLTTVFTSSVYGVINAKHLGRIASVGMEDNFIEFFMTGIKKD